MGEELGVVLGQPVGHGGVVLGTRAVGVFRSDEPVRVRTEAQEHVEVEIGRRARAHSMSSNAVTENPSHNTFWKCRSPWIRWVAE